MDFTTEELKNLLVANSYYLDKYRKTFSVEELKIYTDIIAKIKNELKKRM